MDGHDLRLLRVHIVDEKRVEWRVKLIRSRRVRFLTHYRFSYETQGYVFYDFFFFLLFFSYFFIYQENYFWHALLLSNGVGVGVNIDRICRGNGGRRTNSILKIRLSHLSTRRTVLRTTYELFMSISGISLFWIARVEMTVVCIPTESSHTCHVDIVIQKWVCWILLHWTVQTIHMTLIYFRLLHCVFLLYKENIIRR